MGDRHEGRDHPLGCVVEVDPPIGILYCGHKFTVHKTRGNWHYITNTTTGERGWVSSTYVYRRSTCASTDVTAPAYLASLSPFNC
ncbi:SH3 domain-containing protein [Streptomyces sp. MCA2]|uniref:SH3 domain-containing protein n=1 Tax=Streptomyces sp. MCA2 TaxID=2944805 RepID=UPI0027E42D74|nr:SH3 domain-containing protein [Streptomyces sp. MCA2]